MGPVRGLVAEVVERELASSQVARIGRSSLEVRGASCSIIWEVTKIPKPNRTLNPEPLVIGTECCVPIRIPKPLERVPNLVPIAKSRYLLACGILGQCEYEGGEGEGSRQDQRLESQRDASLVDGCERIFEEKVFSREAERKALREAFDAAARATCWWWRGSTGWAGPSGS